jgi:predicted amidophosphoribosyltransferase
MKRDFRSEISTEGNEMKYCSQCGKELVDEAVVCPNCGCAVQAPVSQQEDKPSTVLNILAFLFPVIGLILFLCFQKTTPVRAKAIGKWTLDGFVVGVALSILVGILGGILGAMYA